MNPNDYWRHQDYDPYKGMNDEERLKTGCWQLVVFIVTIAIGMIICSFFTSCKSVEYVFVPQTHTDTLIQTKIQHDSIYINDSTVITENGDTVRIEKWHTKYVEKQVHDTTYVSKTDSVPAPYPVTEYVEKEMTWWQQTRLHIANILLFVALIYAFIKWGIPLLFKK